MKQKKFIYILGYNEGDDLEDIFLGASTDVADVINKLDCTSYEESIKNLYVGKNDCSKVYVIHIGKDAVQYFKEHAPVIYTDDDTEEVEYVASCLSEWRNKRDAYVKEKIKREAEQKRTRKEEEEYEQYLYLKEKFEKGE